MSRVGRKKIVLPDDVNVDFNGKSITIAGKMGMLSLNLRNEVDLKINESKEIEVILRIDNRSARAFQGLTRSLIYNMVVGVSRGFKKSLEVNGIGYKVEKIENKLILNLGYSHDVIFEIPEDISADLDRNIIKLSGIDKQKVGQTASSIRMLKPPEPYKGKGIKYVGERINRKAGKTGIK